MTINKNSLSETLVTWRIRFQDNDYGLNSDDLRKQVDANTQKKYEWHSPTLKFVSFQEGKLTLLNTHQKLSYKLILEIRDNSQMIVSCSCGNTHSTICPHAYGGLMAIISDLGHQYFEKLRPRGTMALAFSYKNHFDKKESIAGLDVSPRVELKSVYQLAQKMEKADIPAILKLPGSIGQADKETHENTLGYLLMFSARNRQLPFIIPCQGKLNKNKTEIKIFNRFLNGLQKEYKHLLTDSQKELNTACYHLWRLIEKLPGYIIQDHPVKNLVDNLRLVFDAWQKMIPLLKKQPFIYSYYSYGVRELKGRPAKGRIQKIEIAETSPTIRFLLSNNEAFYQLEMQVLIRGKIVSDCETGITLLFRLQQTIFLFSNLRDAAIAEWMYRSGGMITIFKEHYPQFEKEILNPIRECYTVEMTKSRKVKAKNR